MTRALLFHLPPLLRAIGPCIALLLLGLTMPPETARAGGFYRVAECSPGHTGTPDARVEGSSPAFSASTSCAGGNWLQVQSAAAAAAGVARQWTYTAPAGTRIKEFKTDYALIGDSAPDGNRSFLFIRKQGQAQQENISVVGLGSATGTFDSALQDQGPLTAVGVGAFCSKASGTCNHAPSQVARMSKTSFLMEDVVPPNAPVLAGVGVDGAWIGGTTQLAVGDTDTGSGVHRTTVAVAGQQVVSDTVCQPEGSDGLVSSMAPCDAIELRYLALDTSLPAFEEGPDNEIRVCTHEYGFAAASTCATTTLKVDNVAPERPQSLAVAGGEGWRHDNDFDLSWDNPDQAHAPIAAATVELTGPNGYEASVTRTGDGIDSLDDVTVPGPGSYRAEVFLRDAAGNESPLNAAAVQLRFDDTVPAVARPEKANGWLSRRQVQAGFLQSWRKLNIFEAPPSGIAGYRVAVNTDQDHDPCGGSADPRVCAGPLTEIGIDSNSRMLGIDDLAEGTNWVHVVAVSGSGMRGTEVGRTALKVDLTDPDTELIGAASGWRNHAVDLEVRAEDELSGMTDTDEYPDDSPPRTVLEVGQERYEDADADVTARVATEGVHPIAYWARDLAGNENDGIGENAPVDTSEVKIDLTAPRAAFTNSQDPDDPDRLEVRASDPLSGVAGGSVSFRRRGTEQWTSVPTRPGDGGLIARANSNEMAPGVPYEFRAVVVDRAGNVAVTTQREDGSAMAVTGPFRSPSRLIDLLVDGKRNPKVGYGRPMTVSGRLVDAAGRPIPGAAVDLTEAYAHGSRWETRSRSVTTGADGRFSAVLPKGPSREVVAGYAGDARHLGASQARARARVRGGIAFTAPKRVRAGRRATFRGKVKARGADFSRAGKSVEVQVRIGKRWKTVGRSLQTDSRGRFRLRYRFVANYTKPIRYRFRAVVLRERGWPYLPAKSKLRKLVVTP